jgi:thiol-disulfide isomerase/thioredoxin
MKKSLRWLFSFVLVCNIIIFFLIANVANGEEIAKTGDDDRALDFTLKDLDGRNVRLSDYKGKTILLYFMATWCPECRTTIPHLKEIYSLYDAKGLVLLNINVMEPGRKHQPFQRNTVFPSLRFWMETERSTRVMVLLACRSRL